jgi:DNA-binding LytR/AlgR family response regulator
MMDRTAATGGGVVATRSLASIMSRPRAIIAEDEPLLRDELAELVGSLWPELEIVARTGDGVATLQALEQHVPDVLFLDIRMPGLTGLDVARQVDRRSHVVFVTAYDQHAIAAFEQGAADFVLKPVTAARLATTVARLKERIGRPAAPIDGILRELTAPKSNYLRWINASQGEAVRIITVDDVNYFEADSKYTRVVTAGEESLIRKPIKELADELDPGCFWQIHRSTIVNVNAIAGVRRDMRGRPQVRLKHRPELLAVSEAYAYLFRQM